GYITYSDAARMCYVATNPNRLKWTSETAPTPAEALNAITGLAAYCAAVDIHLADGFIVHHVEIDRSPNRVGQDLKRWFMFQGPDRLVFRVDASELELPVVEDVLVWERVRK
ncbi:MAG: lipocalin-like domain-containing protein, partial [Vicinamibacterales bacterium]